MFVNHSYSLILAEFDADGNWLSAKECEYCPVGHAPAWDDSSDSHPHECETCPNSAMVTSSDGECSCDSETVVFPPA